jgi:hypothetical protein
MGFLRRWLGGTPPPEGDEAPDPGEDERTAAPDDAGGRRRSGSEDIDELERERALTREFDRRLSDLARRQIRFADLAWTPPSERRRDGDWILMESWEVQRPEGKDVKLRSGTRLTWIGPGTLAPGNVRFRTEKGVLVELPAGRETDDGWPDDLQRPRSASAGPDD